MADLEFALDARDAHGKANKRLRRDGIIPAVVFGKGEDSTSVQIDAKEFETLYKAAGRTSIIMLSVPGGGRRKSGIIKSVQRHPLSGSALHVDFFLVNLKQEMEVDVPLAFVGEPPAVEETGGTLIHYLGTVRVKALPTDLPHEIEVNVSTLTSLDVAIHVKDLSLNRDLVHVVTDGDELVAKVVPPRIEEEPEPVVAEGEELEGEEAEAAAAAEGEGAPPAEGETASQRGDATEES
ncbi:MAG: 50S ribosomal protein L25 [Candidatus Limnocylindria bacterium]